MVYYIITVMPGRGQPWKGVGKGNPNRIGTGAIADGSITEADLDSGVTSKLNSAGGHEVLDEGSSLPQRARLDFVGAGVVASDGVEDTTTVTIAGGGGGIDTIDTALLREEFVWTDYTGSFLEKYDKGGAGVINADDNRGRAQLDAGDAVAGSRGEIYTETAFKFDPTTSGMVIDMKQVVKLNQTADGMAICDMVNDPTGTHSSRSSYLGSTNDGFGFIFDPNDSANWQIYSQRLDTITRTVTSTPATQLLVKLEAIFDLDAGTIDFEIDGVNVGQITTNFPSEGVFIHTGIYNTTTTQRNMDVDFWEVQASRN